MLHSREERRKAERERNRSKSIDVDKSGRKVENKVKPERDTGVARVHAGATRERRGQIEYAYSRIDRAARTPTPWVRRQRRRPLGAMRGICTIGSYSKQRRKRLKRTCTRSNANPRIQAGL